MLNNVTLKTKLVAIIVVQAVVITTIIGLIFNSEAHIREHSQAMVDRHVVVLDTAHALKLSVVQVQQWLTDISATRGLDGLNDGFDEAENNAKLFREHLSKLINVDSDNAKQYEAMKPVFERYYDVGKKMAIAYVDQGPAGGNAMMAQFDEAAAALADQVDPFLEQARSNVESAGQTSYSLLDTLAWASTLGAIVFAMLLALMVVMFKSIWTAIGLDPIKLQNMAKRIAEGNLDSHEDEIGGERGVFGALVNMRDQLKDQINVLQKKDEENGRMRSALDNASVSITVSDTNNKLIYLNRSAHALFENVESAVQETQRDFVVAELLGDSIGRFFDDPALRKSYGARLEKMTQFETVFGHKNLHIVASPVYDDTGEYLGRVTQWTDRTEQLLEQEETRQRIEKERQVAAENKRIRVALDSVASNVMLADSQHQIIYLNNSAKKLFESIESDIKTDVDYFESEGLVGGCIDNFNIGGHLNSEKLEHITDTHETEFELGGRVLRCTAMPVFDDHGQRQGSAVEWEDRTEEVLVEREIDALVEAAQKGDLSRRIDINDKDGFFEGLGSGFNALLDLLSSVFDEIGGVMKQVAEGDLSRSINGDYEGVFLSVKTDVNQSLINMRRTLSDIRSVADAIDDSAHQIASGNTSLSERTEQQASSLQETAASMEEITATVRNNADNSMHANQVAVAARNEASDGGEVVTNAISAMTQIKDSSSKISEIIGVIDEIAFQTNLLALNASVEAARAGEQGRGFAVVATEVRNLASRSAVAANEIKDLIKDSVEKVESGASLVQKSGDKLNTIVEGVAKVNDIISEIATASQEQTTGIEQVNRAITSIDESTQQNAALAEEASAASREMSEHATKMKASMSFFKVA